MSGVYNQPDIIFFYKMLHLFFIHPPGKNRNILKVLDQAFSVIRGHTYITFDRMQGCIFCQFPAFSRACEDQDRRIHSVCVHTLSPYPKSNRNSFVFYHGKVIL